MSFGRRFVGSQYNRAAFLPLFNPLSSPSLPFSTPLPSTRATCHPKQAEIDRSKVAHKTDSTHGGAAAAGGTPRHDWWDRSGGLGMDDSLSRPSSRSSHLRVPPGDRKAAGSGGSALQHQQQQQQQSMSLSLCRPKTYGDACLDELSRAVGLQ